jgi:hypothetical protein
MGLRRHHLKVSEVRHYVLHLALVPIVQSQGTPLVPVVDGFQTAKLSIRARQGGEPLAGPALEHRNGLFHVAVRRPIRVESGRFVRDSDVIDKGRDDRIAPDLVDKPAELGAIEHAVSPLSRNDPDRDCVASLAMRAKKRRHCEERSEKALSCPSINLVDAR